jgi:hypothetical protein
MILVLSLNYNQDRLFDRSLHPLVEQQICIFAVQSSPGASTIIVVVPIVPLYAGSVVPVHQRSVVVDNAQQLIPLLLDLLEFLEQNRRVHLLPVNHVSVTAVIEAFQVDYEILGQLVETHGLVGQFVGLAGRAVPSIVLS